MGQDAIAVSFLQHYKLRIALYLALNTLVLFFSFPHCYAFEW